METEEIRACIRKGDLHPFYTSAEWLKLAAMARAEQHNECQRCKAAGYYAPCEIVHHKLRVKEHPERALDLDNLECLCQKCHNEEHRKARGYVNEERW